MYHKSLIVFIIFLSFQLLFFSCQQLDISAKFGTDKPSEYLGSSVIWTQTSAEARALYYQIFSLAKFQLQQQLNNYNGVKPPAIIVDVDETVLDNSPYEAMLIADEYEYPKFWDDWIDYAIADPVPGALDFLLFADSLGVDVFYITNRSEKQKPGTLLNLKRVNFPDAVDSHLMMKTDTSDKTSRRIRVGQTHEILLLCGDNLGDFDNIFQGIDIHKRASRVDSLKHLFGSKFIILPNPMYGDWMGAVYDYDYSKSDDKKEKKRQQVLKIYSKPIK